MHVIDRRWIPTLLLAVSAVACSESAATLAAQVAQDGAAIGAQTITPADLRARIGVLAHDSIGDEFARLVAEIRSCN